MGHEFSNIDHEVQTILGKGIFEDKKTSTNHELKWYCKLHGNQLHRMSAYFITHFFCLIFKTNQQAELICLNPGCLVLAGYLCNEQIAHNRWIKTQDMSEYHHIY